MFDNNTSNIYGYVRYMENRYRFAYSQIAKYVNWSLSETVQTIYSYLNSKHITGEKDSLNRDKPFFNIVVAARNIWFRATDIDRKNILIRPSNSKEEVPAFLATQVLRQWMNRQRFGIFLNDWGLVLAGFGSAVSKWVEKDGELNCSVIPWNQIICDNVDFEQNPKIEVLEYTPAQLRTKKEYDQGVVESLLSAVMNRLTITGQIVDPKPEFIRIYEVHGMFPESFMTGEDKDKNDYTQQMHVVAYTRTGNDGKFKDFTLYKGHEDKDPYILTHLIKEDGRALAIGAVEHLFQNQWMVNHSMKAAKDQLDFATKLAFQTSDPTFTGQNLLTSIETGQILQHKPNEPLTSVPNGSHDVGTVMEYMNVWKSLGNEINSISSAMAGQTPKSGTSWRLQALQLQQSQDLFNLMIQNKGLAIEDMMRTRIIPFIKKQLKNTKEIAAIMDAHDITKIDSMYIPREAIRRFNQKVIDHVMSTGKVPKPGDNIDLNTEMAGVKSELSLQGNTRYFKPSDITSKTWADMFKDFEWECEVDVSGENSDKNQILTTLNTALQMVMNPAYAQNPQAQMIVSKVLSETGIVSPLEIQTTMPAPAAPLNPTLQYRNPSVPNIGG